MNIPGNETIIAWTKEQLNKFAFVLNEHLQGRSYVAGDTIILADYSIIHTESFKEAIPFDWGPFPYLNSYFDRLRLSPHWAATAPDSPEAIGRIPQSPIVQP